MKVLIISHNAFSTHQSMGKTFLSLFSAFEKDELCQLYIYPTIPDVDVCSSYYRITDKEALRGIFKRRGIGGEIAKERISTAKATLFENAEDRNLYRRKGNHNALKRLLRDEIWKLSAWYTKELKEWLERENPTCIFLAPGYAKFIYDIALQIAKDRKLPIVTYICDDYYFVHTPKSWLGKMQVSLLRRKTDQLMAVSTHLITICEEMKTVYQQHFAIPTTVIMTGTNHPILESREEKKEPQAISYFGNIGYHRDRPLAEIGHVLDEINAEQGTAYSLKIYTASPSAETIQLLGEARSVELCDFITGEAFIKAFNAAELLLHVEAFDEESVDTVKHSVSTKIADSLASGIPLLAYAPAQVASMAHLIRHQCALTASTKDELKAMLLTAFQDAEQRRKCVKKALGVAKQYHHSENNSVMLHEIMKGK